MAFINLLEKDVKAENKIYRLSSLDQSKAMKDQKFNLLFSLLLTLSLPIALVAQEEQPDQSLSPYFCVHTNEPEVDRLPLKSTFAEVNIAGVMADVKVTQVYKNEGRNVLEAIYVFPASTRAAVYGMQMIIGERVIEAQIRERQQARQEYEQAREEGRRASLLEQERPNVFQMNVANILPGDEIKVVLQYTELIVPEDGVYQFVYPSVVGPRYSGPTDESGTISASTATVPYLKEKESPTYDFDMQVHLNAGMPIKAVSSASHQVEIRYDALNQAAVQLGASEKQGGDRDFILDYQLAGREIESGLMLYEGEKENYFLLMVQPPKLVRPKDIPAREYIFIVDVSGSMYGFPLDISKKLMRDLILGLRPTDRFNVLLFAGGSRVLSEEPLNASPENVQAVLELLDRQQGGGSTQMLPAMRRALETPRCGSDLSRSIVVITDGYISVERAAFDLIRNNLNGANLFAFGIGSGVNRYLIEGMANVGMGEPLIITDPNQAEEQAEKFRRYIESPVLTQIQTDFGDFEVYDVEPPSLPDVLAERPVIIRGKWRGEAKGTIQVKGYSGEAPYQASFKVNEVKPDPKNAALRYFWAREKIRLLGDYKNLNASEELIQEITNLGLEYNLMTDYTSFVAIDNEPAVVNGEKARQVKQALPLPQGVSNYAVGFDLAIQGVVRKPAKKVSPRLEWGAFPKDLPVALRKQLEEKLETEGNIIYACLSGKLLKASGSGLSLEFEVDTDGKVLSVKIEHPDLNTAAKLCLQTILSNWQLESVSIKKKLSIKVSLNIL